MHTLDFLIHEYQAIPKIANYNGAPALYINEKPIFPMIMMSPWGDGEATQRGQNRIVGTAKTGIHLYVTQQFLDLVDYSDMWFDDNSYNFDKLDKNLMAIIANDKNAHIIIKMYVQAPLWWIKKHMEECTQYADGYEPPVDGGMNVFCGAEHGSFASFASKKWIEDASNMLSALICHLENSPWGKRVIGLTLLNGVCQEWHYWGSVWNHLPDISATMKTYFRKFLSEKYQNDEQKLKGAWKDTEASFASFEVPSIQERESTNALYFRDPTRERKIIDYYECQHQAAYDAITHFSKIVKEASNGRLLAGVYYGYIFTCPWYVDGISMEVSRVLRSPYIDFLASPAAYEDYISRGVGGDSLLRGLPESCKLNGKLYISETDEGAYMCPKVYHECERMENFEQSVANIRKQFSQILTRNVGHWWFDLDDDYGIYLHKEHVEALKTLKRIADESMELNRSLSGEIALVYSLKSLYYTNHTMTNETYQFLDLPAHLLARCGVRYDILTEEELDSDALPEYKLYIFANQFYADDKSRERIQSKLKHQKTTELWIYGAGYISEIGIDETNIHALTGIHTKVLQSRIQQRVMLDSSAIQEVFGELHFGSTIKTIQLPSTGIDAIKYYAEDISGITYGTCAEFGPTVYAYDRDAKVLGYIEGTNLAGLAIKKDKECTTLYSSTVITSTELLRAIARLAGVHIYNDHDDVMMLNNNYICIPVRECAGEKTIQLPYSCDVLDAATKEILFQNVTAFTLDTKPFTTYILQIIKEEK